MKGTVCEFPNEPARLERTFEALVEHVRREKSDLVLLPEMAFYPWLAQTRAVDSTLWLKAVEAHERWLERLGELAPATVAGTRPMIIGGKNQNVGFVWEPESGLRQVHTKYYLPDEEAYWEASWYERGDGTFTPVQTRHAKLGFLICTELWFNRHARDYAQAGVQILVCPRATPKSSVDKWVAGGRTAAVVAGAYCLSSNLGGTTLEGGDFGGTGWVIEPEEGRVLGLTSAERPFLSVEINLGFADKAKTTYPRYVDD